MEVQAVQVYRIRPTMEVLVVVVRVQISPVVAAPVVTQVAVAVLRPVQGMVVAVAVLTLRQRGHLLQLQMPQPVM